MINITVLKPIASAISRELFHSIILLLLLSFFVFFLLYNAPGEEVFQRYLESHSELNSTDSHNLFYIYFIWLSACVTGNLGTSLINGLPVLDQVIENLGYSISLILHALLITVPFVILNISMGFKNTLNPISTIISVILNILAVVPIFWLSYVAIYISSTRFNYLPVGVSPDSLSYLEMLLPVSLLSIGSGVLIHITQHTKSELFRVLKEDYVLYARAKGAKVYKHVIKEGIIFPLLHLMTHQVAYLFSTCIIIEQIFNWPGIGRLLWQATQDRDIPLLLGAVLATAFIIRLTQFCSKIIYIILNPRASHE